MTLNNLELHSLTRPTSHSIRRTFIRIFTARCYASAVLAMGLCLCLSQVGVLSSWPKVYESADESTFFLLKPAHYDVSQTYFAREQFLNQIESQKWKTLNRWQKNSANIVFCVVGDAAAEPEIPYPLMTVSFTFLATSAVIILLVCVICWKGRHRTGQW